MKMDEQAEPIKIHKKLPRFLPWLITLVLVLAIVGGAVLVAKAYYNRQNTKTQNRLSALEVSVKGDQKTNSQLQQQLDDINKKLAASANAQTTSTTESVPTYSVTINKNTRQPSNPYENTGSDFLYVDITVKNTSKTDGYFTVSSTKVKDPDGHSYQNYGPGPDFPAGYIALGSQSLAAGESVTGTVVFMVPSAATSFTFIYDDISVNFNAS